MTLNTQFFNLLDTGRAVRTEDQAEYPGHKVIEHSAIFGIIILFAVGTGEVLVVDAAYPYLAPLRLLVLMAPRAFLSQI